MLMMPLFQVTFVKNLQPNLIENKTNNINRISEQSLLPVDIFQGVFKICLVDSFHSCACYTKSDLLTFCDHIFDFFSGPVTATT